jgi:hypothetical protein
MSETPEYLIDSDVLITAKNRYYAFPICPGFWDSLLFWHSLGRVHCIDRVRQELLNGSPDDDLVQWVNRFDVFREIMLWAQRHSRYTDAAKAKFASGADGWLVAYSKVNETVVVTNEQPAPESKKEIKLPDVCDEFTVPYTDTFSMLHNLGVHYQFSPNP